MSSGGEDDEDEGPDVRAVSARPVRWSCLASAGAMNSRWGPARRGDGCSFKIRDQTRLIKSTVVTRAMGRPGEVEKGRREVLCIED